ncbi:7-carboxy-7-deazaguanine synthase [Cytobacillus horneckiae]|uniref:7-carboxy-7-deazaguanine synthase QueE n=1 Tax=Cytobacillus horneckiae TaxID=549687 RepID=UPI0019D15B6E|nr:7-carboxy-7-deazaguanine synthase QueE [Cytobacillus horneckiae]MBN6889509.1 7-carboxy-7-deazaguanine synthase QueE [Cytobacillus horneckiae]
MSKIPVMEIFGPTIQGEGMVIGQKTMFVRTAGCDYSCAWCDSSFTWDGTGKHLITQMEPEDIWTKLKQLGGSGFRFVTISGGNPALIKNIDGLVDILKKNGIQIGLETQGSKWQDWFYKIDELTISPKPPSSRMITDFDRLDEIIQRISRQNISLKVVVFNDEDYDYAKKIHQRYSEIPFFLQVGNDDCSTTDDDQLMMTLLNKYSWLIDKTMVDDEFQNVKVLPQLHTYIWGNKRGV